MVNPEFHIGIAGKGRRYGYSVVESAPYASFKQAFSEAKLYSTLWSVSRGRVFIEKEGQPATGPGVKRLKSGNLPRTIEST